MKTTEQLSFELYWMHPHLCDPRLLAQLDVNAEQMIAAWQCRQEYKRHVIFKDDGVRKRFLDEPLPPLKFVQTRIHRKLFPYIKISDAAHGFCHGKSRVSAMMLHIDGKCLYSIDFHNAFPSVTKEIIEEALRNSTMVPWAVEIIAELTTYNNYLPQGAPTSPDLFNIACLPLDEKLQKFSEQHRLVYTRYADEVLFSSRQPIPLETRRAITEIIQKEGFKINWSKMRYQDAKWIRPVALGLTVTDKGITLSKRKILNKIRAMLYHATKDPTSIRRERIEGYLGDARKLFHGLPPRLKKPYEEYLRAFERSRQ